MARPPGGSIHSFVREDVVYLVHACKGSTVHPPQAGEASAFCQLHQLLLSVEKFLHASIGKDSIARCFTANL